MSRFAVIAGGGTAGHVHPGLAVARALVDRGHPIDDVLYVGSQRGLEHELVPAAGFDLVTLSGKGIPRRHPIQAARAIGSIGNGVRQAISLLRKERPRVVLSLGGFASVPCSLAARTLRIPVVVHEQNAVPGAANRMIAHWAAACAASFAGTDLPNAILTGNPVRSAMLEADRANREATRRRLGVGADQLMVVATGGSLGALRINRAVVDAVGIWADRADITVHHVIGARDWDEIAPAGEAAARTIDYRVIRFEDDMPAVFEACDLVVSRAGASTTAEIAVVGVPAVLVPLPGAPGDHQTANARALVDAGAAVLVPDADLDGTRLVHEIDAIVAQNGALDRMSNMARSVGRRDAADRVAALLEEHAA